MENLLAILDGSVSGDFGQGALVAIFSILLVFAILAIIIGITTLVNICIKKFEKNKPQVKEAESTVQKAQKKSVDVTDDDMMAAILVASVDYREQTKKQVKVISVKEIK